MKLLSKILLFAVFPVLAAGQSAFDVASVRPGDATFIPGVSGRMKGGPGTGDPGRITLTQQPLKSILMEAWDLKFDQIAGPAWMMSSDGGGSYTITATMPPQTSKEQFQLMLQNLLIERFRIKLHHETRNFPGYELVVAAGGSKLKVTTQDPNISVPANSTTPPTAPKLKADGSFDFPPGPHSATRFGHGAVRIQDQSQSLDFFVSGLGVMVNRALDAEPGAVQPRIIDKTGLTGKYDFVLEYDCPSCVGLTAAIRATMPLLAGRGGAETPVPTDASDLGSGLPNLFNALEKQLGLKLVKLKDVPVDILIIEQADKVPTEN